MACWLVLTSRFSCLRRWLRGTGAGPGDYSHALPPADTHFPPRVRRVLSRVQRRECHGTGRQCAHRVSRPPQPGAFHLSRVCLAIGLCSGLWACTLGVSPLPLFADRPPSCQQRNSLTVAPLLSVIIVRHRFSLLLQVPRRPKGEAGHLHG